MNALMAIGMAIYGTLNQMLLQKLLLIQGYKRRFSYQIKTDHKVYIDDYAHTILLRLTQCIKQ
jgi:UDP-N-acetylmuramate--alanine ligase